MSDNGPYFVYVESKKDLRSYVGDDGKDIVMDDDAPLSNIVNSINVSTKVISKPIHPMVFGKFLFQKVKKYNHSIVGIASINKFKIRVQFERSTEANNFSIDPILKENKFQAYIPYFLTTKTGIVRNFPIELEVEDLLNQDYCTSPYKIIKAERMKRLVSSNDGNGSPVLAPTSSIKVIFQSQTLPDYIVIHSVRTGVTPFIPKPIICGSCLRYGHRAPFCKSRTKRCTRCTVLGHEIKDCSNANKCLYCQTGDHLTTNLAKCPEFVTQKKIKELMVVKNYSFQEALKTVKYKPFADSLSIVPSRPITFDTVHFPTISQNNNSNNSNKRIINLNESEGPNRKRHFTFKSQQTRKPRPAREKPNFILPNTQINIATSPLPPNPHRPTEQDINEENNIEMANSASTSNEINKSCLNNVFGNSNNKQFNTNSNSDNSMDGELL